MRNQNTMKAVLSSAEAPSKEQEKRFCDFLEKKYGKEIILVWQESSAFPAGFRLSVGEEVYDFSATGRLQQFKDELYAAVSRGGDIIPLLKETIHAWTPKALAAEVGTVLTIGDGIAEVSGLEKAEYGEILLFEGGVRGMVQNLSEESIGCILFDETTAVSAGLPTE